MRRVRGAELNSKRETRRKEQDAISMLKAGHVDASHPEPRSLLSAKEEIALYIL